MRPTKERNLRMSGTDERIDSKGEDVSLGTPSPDPWDLSR